LSTLPNRNGKPLVTAIYPPETVNIELDSWRFLQQDSGFQLYGYVILENHLHLIPKGHKFRLSRQAAQLSFIAASEDLSHDMQRFKSYTAKQIIAYLE
jgi:putative transposase